MSQDIDKTVLNLMALAAFVLSAAQAYAVDRISTAKIAANEYELTIESSTLYDVETAQRLLIPAMRRACAGRFVEPGRYRFESDETLGSPQSGDATAFKLVQKIRCVDELPAEEQVAREPILADKDALRGAELSARELSDAYFRSLYANLGNDAAAAINAMFAKRESGGLADADEALPTAPGTVVDVNIYRITVYDNPQSAPLPGVYIAADYQNRAGNIAYHCGFLMWYSEDGSDYDLLRVETGVIGDTDLPTIPQDRLQQVLDQLRCSGELAR